MIKTKGSDIYISENIRRVFFIPIIAFILMNIFAMNAARAGEIKISAATSLTDVITELAHIYQKLHSPNIVKTSFASSSILAKQIVNGAPADLFISADKDWMDYLEKRNLLDAASRKNLLANELVLIAPLGTSTKISVTKDFDLAKSFSGKLCTGDTASVPVGKYAKQALEHYNWWTSLESRVVGTDDVRTALAFVERGECALGIVYSTDAQASKKVSVVAKFPGSSHLPIIYPGALTKKASDDAKEFWQFLHSPAASEVFKKYGFSVKPE